MTSRFEHYYNTKRNYFVLRKALNW